jgi:hypothetical protein
MQKTFMNDGELFWSLDKIRKANLGDNAGRNFVNADYKIQNKEVMQLISKLSVYLQNNSYFMAEKCNAVGRFFLKSVFNLRLSKVKAKIACLAIQDLLHGVDIKRIKQKVMWASEYYRIQYTELMVTKTMTISVIKDVGKLEKIFGIKNRLPCYDYCIDESFFAKNNPYFAVTEMKNDLQSKKN